MTARYPNVTLSVVMPAYNEEVNIGTTIPRAVRSLRDMVAEFEIILLDDCSRDGTAALAEQLAASYPEIRFVRNEVNLRQGGCLAKGFSLARMEYVTHNAMDYPFDFDDLPALLDHVPEADIVVASRRAYPGITASRRFVSIVNRALLRVLFGTPVRDHNFIQVYKRSVLQSLPSISSATSFITPEKIVRAHRAGMRVVEVEVDYHRREAGTPSSANVKNIRRALVDMARLWWELRASGERRPL